MSITVAQLLIWIIIAAVVGVFHFNIVGEPVWEGVPVISSIIAAAVLAALYSAVFYHPVVVGSSAPRRRRWFS